MVMEVNEVRRDFRIMKEAYTKVAEAGVGKPRKKNKPRIGVESWRLIGQRQQINEKILSPYSESKRTAESKIQGEKQGSKTNFEIRQEEMDTERCIRG